MASTIGFGVSLSEEERSMIFQKASGYNNEQIASNLGITKASVRSLKRSALTSSGYSSISNLLNAASQEGIFRENICLEQ